MELGRISSVGNDILGFDVLGNVVNKFDYGNLDWIKICEKFLKVWINLCKVLELYMC